MNITALFTGYTSPGMRHSSTAAFLQGHLFLYTSSYVGFCLGDEAPVRVVRTAHELLLPFVVPGELRAGFACGTRSTQNIHTLTPFLNKPRVHVLYATEGTTH